MWPPPPKGSRSAPVLAYQCSARFNVKFLYQWLANSIATEDWLSGFILRNPLLSIRTPEAVNLARAKSCFNATVNVFFDKQLLIAMPFKQMIFIILVKLELKECKGLQKLLHARELSKLVH